MNTAEKLRFLADRFEDGKWFYVGKEKLRFRMDGYLTHDDKTKWGNPNFNYFIENNLSINPQWSFTEDEKVILRSLHGECNWIARDRSGYLPIFRSQPFKSNKWGDWNGKNGHIHLLPFNHLFKSIQWEDEEPCEFRRYL